MTYTSDEEVLVPGETSDVGNFSRFALNVSNFAPGPAGTAEIVTLSLLFAVIGAVGMFGNILVVLAILSDRRMKKSPTNLFILNMAVADEIIMIFGVAEIVQFMMNRGWLLGSVICRVDRYLLVTGLYVSVATLIAVCVERYVAIVLPLKAHMFCSRRRVLAAIGCIWPLSAMLAIPTALFNTVVGESVKFCIIVFPEGHVKYFRIYKYTEFFLFYLCPLILQIVLYTVTIKRLFFDVQQLHEGIQRKTTKEQLESDKSFDTLKSRRGVVKMLVSCVVIYFVSYSPHQVLLVYNTFATTQFNETWPFLVFVMIIAYVNSAANPVLYGIFSENYRKRYTAIFCKSCQMTKQNLHRFSSYSGSIAFQSTRIMSSRRAGGTEM